MKSNHITIDDPRLLVGWKLAEVGVTHFREVNLAKQTGK